MSFQCIKCNIVFKHRQSLTKHNCKVLKKEEEKRKEEEEKQKDEEIKFLREEISILKKSEKKLLDEAIIKHQYFFTTSETFKTEIRTLRKEIDVLKEENENINGYYLLSKAEFEGLRTENALLKTQNNKHLEKLYNMATSPKSSIINQQTITTNNTKVNSQTVNNVIQLKPFDLNDENIKNSILNSLTDISDEKFEAYVKGGQEGIADAVYNEILVGGKENHYYLTADTSRHIFEFKSTNGQIIKDKEAFKLLKVVHPKILDRTRIVTKKHLKETKDYDLTNIINQRLIDISILPTENKKFCSRLVKIIAK